MYVCTMYLAMQPRLLYLYTYTVGSITTMTEYKHTN